MAEVKVTLKAGSGYADPWIVVSGSGYTKTVVRDGAEESVDVSAAEEVSAVIEELRSLSAFSAVKLISDEFARAPVAGVESIAAVLPGTTEFPAHKGAATTLPPVPTQGAPGTHPVSGAVSGSARTATAAGQKPPDQGTPACSKCGAPTKSKSGTGRNGAYKGYACQADREHFDHIK
jgi:hypothetical protein